MFRATLLAARLLWYRVKNRRGAVLVLTALLMVFMMGLLALSVDVGYMMTVKTELKRAADAAALAGAASLVEGSDVAELSAFEFLSRNPVGRENIMAEPDWEERLAELLAQNAEKFRIEFGDWDESSRQFVPSFVNPTAIRVLARHDGGPLFFSRVFGKDRFYLEAESIARYEPRDIVLVLDFSASMNDDSELRRISEFGESARADVEANIQQIYQELGSPQYGSLQFTPQYYTQVGKSPSTGCEPQITVTFRSNDVYVVSTKDLSNVVLRFSDGTTQRFEGLKGKTGTFKGTGANTNKQIVRCWVKSGCNDSGEGPGYGERFEDTNERIKAYFGLTSIPYPFPVGGWDEYINYVKTSSFVNAAGYRKKYGYLTLVNYWLEKRCQAHETPVLWQVSEQPVKQLKEAVDVFFDYLSEVDTGDRVSLVIYNSEDQTATTEFNLTRDFDSIKNIVWHRQAGHYDRYTNIGAGIKNGVDELLARGRPHSFKMIVLMTDGRANLPSNESTGRAYALQQAQRAADNNIPILTLGVGLDADQSLLDQIAEMTKGKAFIVPGRMTITDFRPELTETFRTIANHRPVRLVK
ncbi:MAG: VWA domain-containing protein [Thermogutta sp.]